MGSGTFHSCAVINSSAQCWGYNGYGQLGNGTTVDSTTAVQVTGLTSGVSAIAAGDHHSVALVNSGVQTWGLNIYGQLGNGTSAQSTTPVQVTGLPAASDATAVTAGFNHTCAIVADAIQCWGGNHYGQLGNNTILET